MSKKILIVTECFYPEEFKINDIALFWKEKGYSVTVLTLFPTYPAGRIYSGYKNNLFSKDNYQGIDIIRLFSVTGYRNSLVKKILKYINFAILASIASIFIGKKFDYIFGFNLGALTDMVPVVIIKKLFNKKTMLWTLDIWPDSVYAYGFNKTKPLEFLLNFLVKFIYSNVDLIAVSSKGFKKILERHVKSKLKISYIPNWPDNLNVNTTVEKLSKENKINFTFAGNIGKVQNLENIIKAFHLLPDYYKNKSCLRLIGDGSNLNYLKKLSEQKPYISFLGKKNRSDMGAYYKSSDFLIISLMDKPIFSLTVPAKLQTYISAKKPILSIINGETSDIVNYNNLGL
jgi:uncharacterized membrane protein required for colicin V production